jgi:dTDP-4-amino-4,6-dideoxygalactose transaminase
MSPQIQFNRPPITVRELSLLQEAVAPRELSGDGYFSKQCEAWLAERLGVKRVLLTHSCTTALEMAARPATRVIMPSSYVGRCRSSLTSVPTRSISTSARLKVAITPRTRTVFVVHYAGCAPRWMLFAISPSRTARKRCCQRIAASPRERFADAACISFHASKNLVSGEGGVLVTDRTDLAERAEIIRKKGTNRSRFLLGQIDKYSWADIGSSYFAFLCAQFEQADAITPERRAIWESYHAAFAHVEARDIGVGRPIVPSHCRHNGHLYYLLLSDRRTRDSLIAVAEIVRDRQSAGAASETPPGLARMQWDVMERRLDPLGALMACVLELVGGSRVGIY